MSPYFSASRRLLLITTAFTAAAPVLPAFAQDAGAPPTRVGQLASLSGNVSFNGSGSGGWAQAAPNYPVTAGDTLYTQVSSQAAIVLDASRITLSNNTELQVTGLDQSSFAATQSQGEAVYAIDYLQPGQVFTITTPRGTVGISQNGQYDIVAGDAATATSVDVFQGVATVTDPGTSLQVTAGQAAYLTGTDQTVAQIGQAQPDSFSAEALAQNAAPPPSYAPPVIRQMTGTAELSQYGDWNQNSQYGSVWYPNVAPGWAPYREGHWANIQPWGWTWVESEPWGFAPFHYGRWIDAGGRWGWAPAPAYSQSGGYGPSYQPVYAPAVVSFFGVALVAGITAAALSSGSVGWVPLAPDEPYYPTYRAPAAYIRQINVVNVRNINNVNITNNYYGGNYSPDRLANRRGATFIPAEVMSRGEHVAGYAHPAPQAMLTSARPIDMGAGSHPGQPAAFRLPEASSRPALLRPGAAPDPSKFAQRRNLPPARISDAPFTGHPPVETTAHATMAPMPNNRPGFVTVPGYHAPPPPPAAQHLGVLPGQDLHPGSNDHARQALPVVIRPSQPQNETRLPPASPADRPPTQYDRPPAQAYHPPAAPYHPAGEAYHPAAPMFHPAQQFHPQAIEQPRPMQMQHAQPEPRPEPAHEERPKNPG